MLPLSCANCWFNPLQYGALGLSSGYCTQHRLLLTRAEETTCKRQMRKDLGYSSAMSESQAHSTTFPDRVVHLRSKKSGENFASGSKSDLALLRSDKVGEAVVDYGALGAKIESLAILRTIEGARAELAMLSLSRAYAHTCFQRSNSWDRGIHLYWWTANRLSTVPEVGVADLIRTSFLPLARQVELAQWSIVMLRLTFLSDVGHHARWSRDRVSKLASMLDEAALASETVSLKKLLRWTATTGSRQVESVLPESRYSSLARRLHEEPDAQA